MVDTNGMHTFLLQTVVSGESWMNPPWVGRGGVEEEVNNECATITSSQGGRLPLGQASPVESSSGSDSSFGGESLAETAVIMAANNSTVTSGRK